MTVKEILMLLDPGNDFAICTRDADGITTELVKSWDTFDKVTEHLKVLSYVVVAINLNLTGTLEIIVKG